MRHANLPAALLGVVALSIAATSIASSVTTAARADGCVAKMGWEPWPPYEYRNADGALTGLDVELVEATAKAAGCVVEWVEMPWARQLASVKGGELTGVPSASRTEEREAFGVFTQPYRTESVHMVFPSGKPMESLSDIIARGGTVGVVNGIYYGDEVKRLMDDPATASRFETVATDDANLRKLSVGRLDAALIDPFVGRAKIDELKLGAAVTVGGTPLHASDIYVIYSKVGADPALIARFAEAGERLRADGALGAIIAKYFSGAGS